MALAYINLIAMYIDRYDMKRTIFVLINKLILSIFGGYLTTALIEVLLGFIKGDFININIKDNLENIMKLKMGNNPELVLIFILLTLTYYAWLLNYHFFKFILNLNKQIVNINNKALAMSYIRHIYNLSNDIASVYMKIGNNTAVDLCTERKKINLDKCPHPKCEIEESINAKKRILALQKRRLNEISKNLASYLSIQCYAMESQLNKTLAENYFRDGAIHESAGADEAYRNSMQKKLIFAKRKRIVLISKTELDKFLEELDMEKILISYIEWHKKRNWTLKFHVTNQKCPFNAHMFDGGFPNEAISFMDFIIFKYLSGHSLVFARNQDNTAVIYENQDIIKSYSEMYNNVWRQKSTEIRNITDLKKLSQRLYADEK